MWSRRVACLILVLLLCALLPAAAYADGGYTVQAGDTLRAIAAKHGTTVAAIVRANGLKNPDSIRPGQRLVIPSGSGAAAQPAPKPANRYTVKSGDTLRAIAVRYGTTVSAIMRANGLTNPNWLRSGMTLVIPAGSGSGNTGGGGGAQTTTGGTYNRYGGGPAELHPDRFVASVSRQHCWLLEDDIVTGSWPCSTGRKGYTTPTGFYRIQSKIRDVYGSRWNFYMPYWLGIYSINGIENGIHGLPYNKWGSDWGDEIGTPISFGCVVLQNAAAKQVYEAARLGMQVMIVK